MTSSMTHAATGSRAWRVAFTVLLGSLPRPVALLVARKTPLPYTEIVTTGRLSGRPRSAVVTLFDLDGQWYVGNPNGTAQWARNLVAGGPAVIVQGRVRTPVSAVLLTDGPERDRAIRSTTQQPPPASLVYRLGRRHVSAAGSYFRLDPATPANLEVLP